MYRNMLNDLAEWNEQENAGIFVLKGAKCVGKTWCAKDFGNAFFKQTIHIEFDKDERLQAVFLESVDADWIDEQIKLLTGTNLQTMKFSEMLMIFDEVQVEEPLFLNVMEYARQRKQLAIMIIASQVGRLHGEELVQDEIIVKTMYPMTFEEFLIANKAQKLCRAIEQEKVEGLDQELQPMIEEHLRNFFVTGGMPEVVQDYIRYRNLKRVDDIQQRILQECRVDIAQSAPPALEKRVLQIWDSVPIQLIKENKKFMYGVIHGNARAREYEPAVEWLVQTGYVRKLQKVKKGIAPLEDYIDNKSFELYHLDHGLLRKSYGISAMEAAEDAEIFDEVNGIISEQFVLAELALNKNVKQLYFWTSQATARIDFIYEQDGDVIPVDVQVTIRTKAQNLKVFHQKYNNRMSMRISMEELGFHKGRLNVPLYGLWSF